MWIYDLATALYYLNSCDCRWSVCIDKIENNLVYFSNGKVLTVQALIDMYNDYILHGNFHEPW